MSSHPPRDLRIVCSSKAPIFLECGSLASSYWLGTHYKTNVFGKIARTGSEPITKQTFSVRIRKGPLDGGGERLAQTSGAWSASDTRVTEGETPRPASKHTQSKVNPGGRLHGGGERLAK